MSAVVSKCGANIQIANVCWSQCKCKHCPVVFLCVWLLSYVERDESGCSVLVHQLLEHVSSDSKLVVGRNFPHLHSSNQSSALH